MCGREREERVRGGGDEAGILDDTVDPGVERELKHDSMKGSGRFLGGPAEGRRAAMQEEGRGEGDEVHAVEREREPPSVPLGDDVRGAQGTKGAPDPRRMHEPLRGRRVLRPLRRVERLEAERFPVGSHHLTPRRVEQRGEARQRREHDEEEHDVPGREDRFAERNRRFDQPVADHERVGCREEKRSGARRAGVPRRTQADVRHGHEESIVDVGMAPGDATHEDGRRDEPHAPVEPSQDHRRRGGERHGLARRAGYGGQGIEQAPHGGRNGDDVAREHHERDLHRQRQQREDSVAPGLHRLGRRGAAHGEGEPEGDQGEDRRDRERVGNVARRNAGQSPGEARDEPGHEERLLPAVRHALEELLVALRLREALEEQLHRLHRRQRGQSTLRRIHARLSSSLGMSSSSLRVPLRLMSIDGKMRLSVSLRSSTISALPVPLNSSKITSSIREPVSTSAVAMIVRLPPSSTLRAAPKNRFGRCSALESTPPESTLPEGGTMVL